MVPIPGHKWSCHTTHSMQLSASLYQTLLDISLAFQTYLRTFLFPTFDLIGLIYIDYKGVTCKGDIKLEIHVTFLNPLEILENMKCTRECHGHLRAYPELVGCSTEKGINVCKKMYRSNATSKTNGNFLSSLFTIYHALILIGKFSHNLTCIFQTFAVSSRNKSTSSDLKNLSWVLRSVDYFYFSHLNS